MPLESLSTSHLLLYKQPATCICCPHYKIHQLLSIQDLDSQWLHKCMIHNGKKITTCIYAALSTSVPVQVEVPHNQRLEFEM